MIIVLAQTKGGVGKSTLAVNFAVERSRAIGSGLPTSIECLAPPEQRIELGDSVEGFDCCRII